MIIMQRIKVRLDNDVTTRKNPDLISGIQPNASKVAQYRLTSDNTREKEEKKETSNKTSTWKLCLQKNKYETFQKCQDYINNVSLSPIEESMSTKLFNLS